MGTVGAYLARNTHGLSPCGMRGRADFSAEASKWIHPTPHKAGKAKPWNGGANPVQRIPLEPAGVYLASNGPTNPVAITVEMDNRTCAARTSGRYSPPKCPSSAFSPLGGSVVLLVPALFLETTVDRRGFFFVVLCGTYSLHTSFTCGVRNEGELQ